MELFGGFEVAGLVEGVDLCGGFYLLIVGEVIGCG